MITGVIPSLFRFIFEALDDLNPFRDEEPSAPPPPPVAEVVPLFQPPPVLEIGEGGFSIDPLDYAASGDRDAILASSGMGKSYLAGVLMEEMLETGSHLLCIIDPEGENYTLAEHYAVIVIGGQHDAIQFDFDSAALEDAIEDVIKTALDQGVSMLWDISELRKSRQQELFAAIAGKLFRMLDNSAIKCPVKLVVEEARVFAPQKATGNLQLKDGESSLSVFEDVATRGRKRGLHFLLATQRPASINKDVLSQCNRWWFGGMQSQQDCAAMRPFLQEAGITDEEVRALKPGEFYFYAQGKTEKIKVKKRRCQHGGTTPQAREERRTVATRRQLKTVETLLGKKHEETEDGEFDETES